MNESSFRAAVESGNPDRVIACLSPDVSFNSPVVFKPYRGRDAAGVVLEAVFQVFEDFHYIAELREGNREVLVFETRVGDRQLQGVDILRLGDDGLVAELIVMVRPMSGMLALAEAMRVKLEVTSPPA
jgi:SnoaL-like domain